MLRWLEEGRNPLRLKLLIKAIDLVIKSSCFPGERRVNGLVKRHTAKKAGSSAAEYVPLLRIAAAGQLKFYSTQSTLHEI